MEIISRKEAKLKGLPRYFTGISCKNGHIAERKVSKCICVKCKIENQRKLYKANPEKIRAQNNASSKKNPETRRAWDRKNSERLKDRKKYFLDRWRSKNSEKERQTRLLKYSNNKEKFRRISKEYRDRNSGKIREYSRIYFENNKEKIKAYLAISKDKRRIYKINRRSREAKAGGVLSVGITEKLLRLQKGKCACCSIDLKMVKIHRDHIIPISKGGKNTDENIQLLCQSCNLMKSNILPHIFMQRMGFLI